MTPEDPDRTEEAEGAKSLPDEYEVLITVEGTDLKYHGHYSRPWRARSVPPPQYFTFYDTPSDGVPLYKRMSGSSPEFTGFVFEGIPGGFKLIEAAKYDTKR